MSLQLEGVSLAFGEQPALVEVSATLEAGRRLAVIGRSGSGKTSLLRVIAGLQAPDAGTVRWGEALFSEGRALQVPPEDRGVSLVFQDLALWPHMTVEQTLSWVARAETKVERRDAALALAARVGLGERLSAHPHQLSGGEQQRLAFARALASEPTLLLLDEPFAHLDTPLKTRLARELLGLLAERDVTLVLVTHDRESARALGQDVVVLEGGRVIESGAAETVLVSPTHATTRELLGLEV